MWQEGLCYDNSTNKIAKNIWGNTWNWLYLGRLENFERNQPECNLGAINFSTQTAQCREECMAGGKVRMAVGVKHKTGRGSVVDQSFACCEREREEVKCRTNSHYIRWPWCAQRERDRAVGENACSHNLESGKWCETKGAACCLRAGSFVESCCRLWREKSVSWSLICYAALSRTRDAAHAGMRAIPHPLHEESFIEHHWGAKIQDFAPLQHLYLNLARGAPTALGVWVWHLTHGTFLGQYFLILINGLYLILACSLI